MVKVGDGDGSTWSRYGRGPQEGVKSWANVVDGGKGNDGWGNGCLLCGRGCLHPCRGKMLVKMADVVVVGRERGIGRVCRLTSGMLTSSWCIEGGDAEDDEDVEVVSFKDRD